MTTRTNATRRTAREWAIQMLTAAELNPPEDLQAFMSDYFDQISDLEPGDGGASNAHGKLKRFAEERFIGVKTEEAEIDAILQKQLADWDIYRLGTVERVVMRMGIWELKNKREEIPPGVVINEALDLANWFSTPKSRTLINGVLDGYAKATENK